MTLRKVKKDDNWFSIHKVKTIGGHDSDWKRMLPNLKIRYLFFIFIFKNMADQEPVKEGKEDYTMTRIAFSFNIRQETALQKFKKSFESDENK